ncbi:MAG: KorB domain-containing protein [Gallionella sp.]
MNDEPKPDKLAERIAARRAEAAREEQQAQGVHKANPATSDTGVNPAYALPQAQPRPNGIKETLVTTTQPPLDQFLEAKIREAREAIAAGVNPMKVARLLSGIISLGMAQKDLAAALGVNKSWLSKRLGLLVAPIKVQQLIESGGLSESEYHNKKNVALQIKGRAGMLEYRRMPQVTINIEAARSLVAILQILADRHGATPINLKPDSSKKDITSILTYRAGDILELLK